MDRQMATVIRAWYQLDSDRPSIVFTEPTQAGPAIFSKRGAIPWTSIDRWGAANGLSRESIELLSAVIHVLDIERQQQER